jgi:hypothetical protein
MITDPFGTPCQSEHFGAPVNSGDLTWVLVLPGTVGLVRRGGLRRGAWGGEGGHDPTNVARRER